jgi:hypothetical protein
MAERFESARMPRGGARLIVVAYNFQRQFVGPILAGTKGGTIRLPRKPGRAHIEIVRDEGQLYARERPGGHVRPGEIVQLYTSMRTTQCRLITTARCVAVEPITLVFDPGCCARVGPLGSHRNITGNDLNDFARFDGFADWSEMMRFWAPARNFEGWHIRWLPLPWERG